MRAWDDDSVNAKIVGVAFLLTTQRYHGRPPGPADSVQKVGGRYGAPPIAISVLPTTCAIRRFLDQTAGQRASPVRLQFPSPVTGAIGRGNPRIQLVLSLEQERAWALACSCVILVIGAGVQYTLGAGLGGSGQGTARRAGRGAAQREALRSPSCRRSRAAASQCPALLADVCCAQK